MKLVELNNHINGFNYNKKTMNIKFNHKSNYDYT